MSPGRASSARVSAALLDLHGLGGLTEEEARIRLGRDGPNELPSRKGHSVPAIALRVLCEPMFLMLVAAGSLYLLMGELADALMLLGFVLVVMGITIVQERRTERALDALRDLTSPRALVVRGGVARRIPGREVVRGDVLVLSEGDRVPADALLRRAINLTVDESLLTGEAVAVRKAPSDDARALDRPGGDDLPSVFSGTLVATGQGVAEVIGTGLRTELGRIGKALEQLKPEPTLLQKETRRLVRTFTLVGLAAWAVVVVSYALTRGGGATVWKEGLLAGIAMAMAILPEEFPVVLTVFLALGAWRISRSKVLTRRMPAVETLGAATVLCVDKTGTLTQNQMRLRALSQGGCSWDLAELAGELPQAAHGLLETAILASKRDPFDPMERALHTAGERWLVTAEPVRADGTLLREYPLCPELPAVSNVWASKDGDEAIVAAKGAPEAIAELCHLGAEPRQALERAVAKLASQGLRVLAVARGRTSGDDLPARHCELDLELVGLLGLEDPLRPTVATAVGECQAAGVRVVMVTGDYPATAQSIARQAGIAAEGTVITGPELAAMSDQALAERIGEVQIFARVAPEQKLRIVQALKQNGEIVAMTGDGVNDAPALKAAHIGIAMGARGTDVAREAASLVLLDDEFSSIVAAIRLGRRIFDNIKKAITFILAVHVPIVGLSMLPVFFAGWPLLLLPVHIVFLELVIDPSCSLIFEAEQAEADVMRRPPRDPSERLFSSAIISVALLQGLSMLAACVAVYLWARTSRPPDAARALAFATLVVGVLGTIVVNRSWTRPLSRTRRAPNAALRWVLGGTAACLGLVLLAPSVQRLFHFAPLGVGDLALAVGAGLCSVVWFEVAKRNKRWARRLRAMTEGSDPQS